MNAKKQLSKNKIYLKKIDKIMKVMNSIKYGFLDETGTNIFEEKNFEYIFNKKYHLMSPKELLEKKCGVCWEQVELERKMFEEYKIECATYFIYIDDKKILPSHTFLTFDYNNNSYWFEHSWYDYRGIHEYNDINELLNDVENKFIKSHENEVDVKYRTYIYNYKKPKYGIRCDEFYNFIYSQNRVYNYKLKNTNSNDFERIKHYKLKCILDYAYNLPDNEINRIESYIQQNLMEKLNDYKNIIYNTKIIGSILVDKDNDKILIDEIYLEKGYRNKGIGTSIIKKIINDANNDIYLWVYKNNINAYKLYLKLGFNVFDETDTRYKMKYTIS